MPKVKIPETGHRRAAGNDNFTTVLGDPKDARTIAQRSIDVVQRFSQAVFKQDLETAYGLCANELRTWMSVKRLFTELQKADEQFGGSGGRFGDRAHHLDLRR
jgi:hypothetical protein